MVQDLFLLIFFAVVALIAYQVMKILDGIVKMRKQRIYVGITLMAIGSVSCVLLIIFFSRLPGVVFGALSILSVLIYPGLGMLIASRRR